jgi:hypothetical protein
MDAGMWGYSYGKCTFIFFWMWFNDALHTDSDSVRGIIIQGRTHSTIKLQLEGTLNSQWDKRGDKLNSRSIFHNIQPLPIIFKYEALYNHFITLERS